MTKNEHELLKIINNASDPASALIKAAAIITEYLKATKGGQENA